MNTLVDVLADKATLSRDLLPTLFFWPPPVQMQRPLSVGFSPYCRTQPAVDCQAGLHRPHMFGDSQ